MPIDLNEHRRKQNNNQPSQNVPPPNNNSNNRPNSNRNNGSGFNMNSIQMPNMNGKFVGFLITIAILIFFFILARPFIVINSGEVGIKVNLGEYQPAPLLPGLHFFVPILQNIIIVDTRVRTQHFISDDNTDRSQNASTKYKSPIQVRDKQALDVSIELTLKYRLEGDKASAMIRDYTMQWDENIVVPYIAEAVASTVGNFNAEELPSKRDEVARLIIASFKNKIASIKDQSIQFDSLELRKIILPQQIKDKIEQVQVAKQEAERAKQEANALRERAQGKADASITEAKGQAEANRLVSESLSSRLLELRQIEIQGKFNEALRDNRDAQIFLTPGGAVPNIWVDSKNKQRTTISNQ
ncbi:hypothetical protein CQA53_00460 [Helicobacter didelphidarum]|uniref:Band 7 domain-containing protein n=1 Tax=Helicobacter didelphidarum TaxID=2040648 RepID=A0A3D8IQG0_9HELI|nr:prohibitin family protein [Helicobacter didelphidarum]RDU67527.1 hypothetical protein CQA53_00460 [Helicobacter didelphidarum]